MAKLGLYLAILLGFTPHLAAQQDADNRAVVDAAVNHVDRFETDSQLDDRRKPAEVLSFFGVKPGDRVLDIFSGSGYYSELLSRIVGAEGQVIAHTNPRFRKIWAEQTQARYGTSQKRLANVYELVSEIDDLSLAPDSLDLVVLLLTLHDFYFDYAEWLPIDEAAFFDKLFVAIKPGGRIGVVDHNAAEGVGATEAQSLHRIERATVIQEITRAGFKLIGEETFLRNPEDRLERNVFDPSIRRKTDRFVLLFERPAQ